jgi:exodeoxyribonuclease V gamma subunit
MGIRIYLSNDQEQLASKCAENISVFKSVFRPVNFVTQTPGMNRWLSISIAEKNGVFGNFNFQTPNGLVNQLFYLAKLRNSDIFDTEKTRWLVYDVLETKTFKAEFPAIANYYNEDPIKQIQLATRVADLFDQYFVYRPDMVQCWTDENEYKFKNKSYQNHSLWQSYIWRQLRGKIVSSSQDKVSLKTALVTELQNPDFIALLQNEITGVTLFGLSLLTEYHIEIIHHLSQCIQVDLYFLNPAPFEFWYDNKDQNLIAYIERKTGQSKENLYLQEGNTLLASMGKAGQNSFAVFFNDSDFINSIVDDVTVEPAGNQLLDLIQSDIFYNKSDKDRAHIPREVIADGSIQITSSFTIAREVESLYNYLLHQFETNTDLKPKEIIVMCSNIDAYAPYIQAIFNLAPKSRAIPYSIADQSYSDSSDLMGVLDLILGLNTDRFSPEKVLQICENPIVSQTYAIKDHRYVQQLVDQCNIRIGISGSENDHSHYVSWKYGLEKIILSYAMEDQSAFDQGLDTIYAVDGVEGENGREALRFYSFAKDLIQLTLDGQRKRPLKDWKTHIEKIISTLFSLDKADIEEVNYLQLHLNKLVDMEGLFDQSIPYEVFKNAFLGSLFRNQRSGRFITGKVTFSSMIPMRSIPFKTVALLGLDRDKFPRKEDRLGFNLMEAERRRSDRNVRDNDKYLFLESILSAKNSLYLSYIGQNAQDGTKVQPSIVVDELLNYVSRKSDLDYSVVRSILVDSSPLHTFTLPSSGEKPATLPYSGAIQPYTEIKTRTSNQSALETTQVNIIHLVRFFNDPFKYHYNKVLGIYFDQSDESIKETEMFELDPLQNYWLKEEVLKPDFDEKSFVDRYEKSGLLPLKNMARVPVSQQIGDLSTLKEFYLDQIDQEVKSTQQIDLLVGNLHLVGEIGNIYGKSVFITHFSSDHSKEKVKIHLCILSLLIEILGLDLSIYILTKNGAKEHYNKNSLGSLRAIEILEKLLEYYVKGLDEIICFAPMLLLDNVAAKPAEFAMRRIIQEAEETPYKQWHNPYIRSEVLNGYFKHDISNKHAQLKDLQGLLKCYE